jgi:hypothetical protein
LQHQLDAKQALAELSFFNGYVNHSPYNPPRAHIPATLGVTGLRKPANCSAMQHECETMFAKASQLQSVLDDHKAINRKMRDEVAHPILYTRPRTRMGRSARESLMRSTGRSAS